MSSAHLARKSSISPDLGPQEISCSPLLFRFEIKVAIVLFTAGLFVLLESQACAQSFVVDLVSEAFVTAIFCSFVLSPPLAFVVLAATSPSGASACWPPSFPFPLA
jgi:hypothetical protein